MKINVLFLSASLLALSPVFVQSQIFASASVAEMRPPLMRDTSLRKLVEDKENASLLHQNVPETVKLGILMDASKMSNEPPTAAEAKKVVDTVTKDVATKFKTFKDKREAKREIFAGIHALLDKKYYAMRDDWDQLQDKIDAINKKVLASLDPGEKATLVAERSRLRTQAEEIANARKELFGAIEVIASAHDMNLG